MLYQYLYELLMITIEQLLIKHEALRLLPYKDSTGHLTIGVGRNLTDVGLSKDECMMLLHNDINRTVNALQAHLAWYNQQPTAVRSVLTDMCFNMGIDGLLEFHTTLGYIQAYRYKDASVSMLQSLWARQVGSRATEDSKMLASA